MAKQIYFEDIKEGSEIPKVVLETSTRQSAVWAIANEDPDPIHFDKEFALGANLPGPIVNGRLKLCLLMRLVTDWMGTEGTLRAIGCQHRGMNAVGDPITARGKVTRKYTENGENLVECEIWVETPEGKVTAPGSATVAMPARK
ncbi:MaoC/PaaZ C-terminal domain-containing protein [Chloroflexota bacterium]